MSKGSFVAASLLLLAAVSAAFAQQPVPPPSQPGGPPPPSTPTLPPSAPPQPAQPGAPVPPTGQEPAPETEAPAPPPLAGGSAGGVVPENPFQAEQPTITVPGSFLGPNLFNPPVPRGWITLTPTFTLSGEYNDNVHEQNDNRKSDFIFGFTPGVTLSMQRPEYRLLAGYNVTSQVFAKETDLSGFANKQQLFADGFYLLSPSTRLTLTERFFYDEDTSAVSPDNVSSGRSKSLRNVAVLGVQHQLTQLTTLRAAFTQVHVHFSGDDESHRNSDTFRLLVGTDHQFTGRLRGFAEFDTAYFTVQGESDAYTQRPRLGFDYQITQTLSAGLAGGPTILSRDHDTKIKPSITAHLTQLFSFGSLRAGYDHSVTAGTFGLTDRDALFATFSVSRFMRGLLFEITPRYTMSNSEDIGNSNNANNGKFHVVNLDVRATYQLTQALALIGSYRYFFQRQNGNSINDIDQNRVFFGVQYAYPITFY